MMVAGKLVKLLLVFIFCLLVFHATTVHSLKSPTDLTITEASDEHTDEEKRLDDEDPEDLEVFRPTDQWQTLKAGQAVPAGSHVRLNLQTGQREVKLDDDIGSKYRSDGNRREEEEGNTQMFTAEELKQALKKFKEGMDDSVDTKVNKDAVKAQFRPIEELKKDMEALEMMVETDVQVMRRLLNQFNDTGSSTDEQVRALLDLEYLVHQVDNARNLVSMGGMQLVINALNSTDSLLQQSAAFVLGSAVSSNPSVQVEAAESGAVQKLLTLLATQRPVTVKKKVLFAVAALLRHFPFAQAHFLKLGGVQVLGDLFQTPGADALRVRIITILYDMIVEKELITQVGLDSVPDSSHQERLRQYAEVSLLPLLVEQGWCGLVVQVLDSPEHDCREKALRTLLAMMPECQLHYKQNRSLTDVLDSLRRQYQELELTERDVGEHEGYFGEILALVDSMVIQIQQA